MQKLRIIILTLFIFIFCSSIFAYTQKEYRIYSEMMKTPMSVSEDEAHRRLGKKYGMSPVEVKALINKVMTEIYSTSSAEKEIRKAVEKLTQVKTLIVSGEFANLGYTEKMPTGDRADVKKKVLARMPKILEAVFSVSRVERVRLTAYYPTTTREEMKVATLEAYRFEFKPEKLPKEYSNFWVKD